MINHRVQKFDSNGNFLLKWGESGDWDGGEIDGQLCYPSGIALDSSGNVYVAEQGNRRVQKFDSNGNFITKFGIPGTGNGQLDRPFGIAIDSCGSIYVADTYNHRVQKFSPAY